MSWRSRNFNLEPQPFSSFEWRVPLASITWSEEEVRAATDVLRSGWWTYGPVAQRLEDEFSKYLGVRHAIAVANGTAALHLAHLVLALGPGDEVITPSLNFVAAANTILRVGGIPHFADVASIDTPVLSVEKLEQALTPATRGICLLHYAGFPCAMQSVMEFARHHKLWVVEDAAHAPGGFWQEIPCGKWGDVGCFSFFGNKNLTCGEGGMVVTDRDDLAPKLRELRSHGMTSLTWERRQGHRFSYDVTEAGFNYRIDDLRAAVLRVQLQSLERFNRCRQERVAWYRELLKEDARWSIPFEQYEGVSSHHLFTVVLPPNAGRERVVDYLKQRGIQSSMHYPPVHQFTFYRKLSLPSSDLKNTETLGQRLLTLPLFPEMTRKQVEWVCESFREAIAVSSIPDSALRS